MSNLFDANHQWAVRPPDERFWNLDELIQVTEGWKRNAVVGNCALSELQFCAQEGNVMMVGKTGAKSQIGHYAFGQMSRLLQAPPDYLRELPAGFTAELLNLGVIRYKDAGRKMSLLLQKPTEGVSGAFFCRAALSDKYTRIWNCDLAMRVQHCLMGEGWRTPPAVPVGGEKTGRVRCATAEDIGKVSRLKVGDAIGPSGLYASEKDMFMFLINESNPVTMNGIEYFRGCFIENSEVGDRKNSYTMFLFNQVCGNHIVWDVPWMETISIIHRSDADDRAFLTVEKDLSKFAQMGTEKDCDLIKRAGQHLLGKTQEEVVDTLWSKRISGVTQGELAGAVLEAHEHEEDLGGASPRSVWGVVQGITRLSQKSEHADKRVKLDRVGSKILSMAF